MPVLPLEPHVYPADLFTERTNADERTWWVLHTKPRQEKALARQMLQARIPYYLPLIERTSLIRGHYVQSHVPLFTSYVFLLATQDERVTALDTKRVVHSLPVPGQEDLWQDLAQVNRLITAGLSVTPERQLFPGAMVEIILGPLVGLKGKIIREASRRRFVVQVDFIQQGVSVLLDDFMLVAATG